MRRARRFPANMARQGLTVFGLLKSIDDPSLSFAAVLGISCCFTEPVLRKQNFSSCQLLNHLLW